MRVLLAVALLLPACRDRDAPAHRSSRAQKIVSQTVTSDEILWRLGEPVRARVVGVSKMADDALYSGVPNTWPDDVPRIAGTSETLVAAGPDLVIVADFTAVETLSLLEHSGIPTLRMQGFDGFGSYPVHVRQIASAVDETAAGEDLISHFETALAAKRRPTPEPAPTIVSWVSGMVAGRGSTFDDAAAAAGYENLAATHGFEGHRNIRVEQLVAWNPQHIVVDCADDCAAAVAQVREHAALQATTASREGGVIAIQSHMLYSTGEGMLDLIEALAQRGPK